MLSKTTNQLKSIVELGFMCPWGPPAVDTQQVVEI